MGKVKINSKFFANKSIEDMLQTYKIGKNNIKHFASNGRISVNHSLVDLSYIINQDDNVILEDIEMNIVPFQMSIEILYEDEYIIAINKPANILVHTDGNTNETLQNAVYNYLIKHKKNKFCQTVHRLDYETTGIVLFAKNSLSLAYLAYAFENREVKKEYVALINGVLNPCEGIINKPLGKDRHSNLQIVYAKGKSAITKYKTIWYKNGISKISINIIGGRKHQIRVHLNSVGHPIIGDKLYSLDMHNGLKLHASKICFINPETMTMQKIQSKENF
ncbi:MAG: RluA family pseudouridine synthase [Acholeplasmataceae bacterium]|nr:RluA family pseudouridine synthase [Acholeplasmataceae bacterium]